MILSSVLADAAAADAATAAGGRGRGGLGLGVCGTVLLSLSSASGPDLLLRALEQHCEYARTATGGWVLRPPAPTGGQEASPGTPAGGWLVVFLDEVNLPAEDRYGTQRIIAFMRGLVEQVCRERERDVVPVSVRGAS